MQHLGRVGYGFRVTTKRTSGAATTRADLLRAVADLALARPVEGPLRIGVDGVDGAGKTVFADEVAAAVVARGREAIRAGVDDFHLPRAHRYRLGRRSPEGYYRDSFDYPTMRRLLLDPLAPGGDRWTRTAAFDHRTDRPIEAPPRRVADDAVVIVDGVFLHRPELAGCFDFTIFLQVGPATSCLRCAQRDGSDPDPGAPDNHRYVAGQQLYLSTVRPQDLVDVLVDHEDVAAPILLRAPAR